VYFAQIRGNPHFAIPIMDEGYHDLWAREIAAGDWSSRIPFFRAPFYPLLLGLAYRFLGTDPVPFAALRGGQLLIGAATPWLVHRIGRRIWPARPGLAFAASMIVALDGLLVYFEADLLLESLLAPMMSLFVLLVLRAGESRSPGRWLLAGLLLGLLAITRPNILLFAPVLFVLAATWGRSLKPADWRPVPALALTVGTCLLVLPVTWANSRVGHDRVLVATQAGLNFFLGNNEEANGWSATAPKLMSIDWWGGYEDAIRLAEEDRGHELQPSEVSAYWFGRAFDWWREHPAGGAVLTLRKATYFLSGVEFSNNRDIARFVRTFAPVATFALYLYYAVMPLALLGIVGIWRRGPGGRFLVLLLAVYAVSIVAFFVTARYRVPLRPLFAILAVEGGRWVLASLRSGGGRGAVPAAAAIVLGVAVNANPWVLEYQPTAAQFRQSVANLYHEAGDLDRALDWQLRALEDTPDYPKGNLNLGTLYMAKGDVSRAADAFQRERVLDPSDSENLASLGLALMRTGRPEEAAEAFAESEALGMRDAATLYNHGVCLERLDRTEEAEAAYLRAVDSDPGFADAWNNLGVLRAREGRLEEAIAYWERAAQADPTRANVQDNLRRARARLDGNNEGG
jgi:Flp pilus assembly protein TadD